MLLAAKNESPSPQGGRWPRNGIQRRVERRPLTPEVVEARIACRVAELRVLAARTSILAARAHVPSDIWFASQADVARAIATAIAKRKQR